MEDSCRLSSSVSLSHSQSCDTQTSIWVSMLNFLAVGSVRCTSPMLRLRLGEVSSDIVV